MNNKFQKINEKNLRLLTIINSYQNFCSKKQFLNIITNKLNTIKKNILNNFYKQHYNLLISKNQQFLIYKDKLDKFKQIQQKYKDTQLLLFKNTEKNIKNTIIYEKIKKIIGYCPVCSQKFS